MAELTNLSALSTAELLNNKSAKPKAQSGANFGDVLKESLAQVNTMQKSSEKAMADMATGQVKDLHQAAIAIDKAEMSMKLMLEVRNKAINAYKEILRTQM
ncbi:MAG: flagellar hook-basal body protein FliE [Sulfuricurvum sp. PC08-66]|nr:MAG: flagellar hook-basal body protein FliE [Sulfuricurvum sp. PC08-66]